MAPALGRGARHGLQRRLESLRLALLARAERIEPHPLESVARRPRRGAGVAARGAYRLLESKLGLLAPRLHRGGASEVGARTATVIRPGRIGAGAERQAAEQDRRDG